MASQWASRPLNSHHEHNPLISTHLSPPTSPRSRPPQYGTIAARIDQLKEICHSKPGSGGPASTISRRRENSRSGFGKRKGTVFAGPALRISRLNEEPQFDGTHTYLGSHTARTNHTQEHATVRRTGNWEKTTGLHAQMQPTGFKADESTNLWAAPLKANDCSPTRPRKYDRDGNLILAHAEEPKIEPATSRSPMEHGHVSKFPSLSTVLESQLLEREKITPSVDNHRFSSSYNSIPNETPLSIKKKNVREMYDYYGIRRPAELSSEYGTLEAAQPIRVERHCHVCGWINGPDTKCWKCMHRFCDECDDISPRIFFHTEETFPLEDFEMDTNPIKLSSTDAERQMQGLEEKFNKREDMFSLQFPCIDVPELTSISPSKNTNVSQEPLYRSSPKPNGMRPRSPKKPGLRKATKPSTRSLRSKHIVGSTEVDQSQQESGLYVPISAIPASIGGSRSSAHQPLPIYIQDIPKRSHMAEKLPGKYSAVSRPLQAKTASSSAVKHKQPRSSSHQRPTLPQSLQDNMIPKVEQTKSHKERHEAPNTKSSRSLKSGTPTDLVLENQPYHRIEALVNSQSSRLKPVNPRTGGNGSHRHRRIRRHASGSQSNSSSSLDHFSCESPGCQATHTGHQPYHHSISCMHKKNRFGGDTDSGYIASRSYPDDLRVPLPRGQVESSLDLVPVEHLEHTHSTKSHQNRNNRLEFPRERVAKKQPTECAQCYGYLNGCPCGTCQSINQIIMKDAESPLLPENDHSRENDVLMPQLQSQSQSQSQSQGVVGQLDPLRTVRHTLNSRPALDETQLAPVESVKGSDPRVEKLEPGNTSRKVSHQKVVGDMLGKPISLGYEPVPKIPLHTITYIKEETSRLPSVSGTFNPGFSDLPTPVTEKAGQGSFFAGFGQQPIEGGSIKQQESSYFPNVDHHHSSAVNDFLALDPGAETRTPMKLRGETRSQFRKADEPQKQQDFSTLHSSLTEASFRKSPPTPASRSLSVILERDALQFLNQKFQQQQYELERITRLFQDQFAEISQPYATPNDASLGEKSESETTPEEKEAKEEEAKARTVPWRLNLFGRKPSEYNEPISQLREHTLEECSVDDKISRETSEADIRVVAEMAGLQDEDGGIEWDTPTPKIVVREPTMIQMDTNSKLATEKKSRLVKDSNVKRLARAFSPLGISFGNPKSNSKEKDEKHVEMKDDGNDKGGLPGEMPACSCNCGIQGVTITIHFDKREDMVLKTDLRAQVQ